MRSVLVVLIVLAFSIASADARRRGHRHHYRYDPQVYVVPQERPGAMTPEMPDRRLPRLRSGAATSPGAPQQTFYRPGELVPPNWQLQPPDPNWNGKRFVSPDGAAWFATYATPAEQEPIAAHMKAIAFVEGEEITYLRGERGAIVVSGLKADRIFYRKAVLACGGKVWRHVAFEYPADLKRNMDRFVTRAADAVDQAVNDGCDGAVSSSR